jgi:general L-amino acid transport system substrate-binding protein
MKRFAYQVSLATVASMLLMSPVHAGKTIDAIKARGELVCGVNLGLPGFSQADSQGKWSGLDVDTCRAVAATMLGDPDKVRYVPLTSQQRFTALQSGEIDILPRNTTWTMTRDASLGLHFTGVTYYDGQGFMVPKSLNVKNAKEMRGATVCVQSGTTTELNLSDFSRANNLNLKPVVFSDLPTTNAAYFAGRCQAYTNDRSVLASIRAKEAAKPDDQLILPDIISKEPLGTSVRRGDDDFFAIVKWVGYARIEAEELGITQANVEAQKRDSKNPAVQRLVGGGTEDTGKLLGLDKDWAVRAIKAAGNYGESYGRNIGPLGLPRGLNALWNQGGLMYAMPVR